MQNKNKEGIEGNINFLIRHAPFKLDVNDKITQEIGLFLLPYSIGIEVECKLESNTDYQKFKDIPNIMDVDVNSYDEQRFRIPPGINGIICLFNIANLLKEYGNLNPGSGIHYHIDCTDVYDRFDDTIIKENASYILNELDKWEYKGNYNSRRCAFNTSHNWIRFQDCFKTAEIRIGEMTFEYSLLIKRILHATEIIKTLKSKCVSVIERYGEDSMEIINNRVIKI